MAAELLFNVDAQIKECASEIKRVTGKDAILVPPFGSLEARIRLVLDHGAVNKILHSKSSSNEERATAMPMGLKESGFAKPNSLIWAYNHPQNWTDQGVDGTNILTVRRA